MVRGWKSAALIALTIASIAFPSACASSNTLGHQGKGGTMISENKCNDELFVKLLELDKQHLPQREFDGPRDESSQGSSIHVYYLPDGSVGFLTVVYFGEMGRTEVEYALLNNSNFQYMITDITYEQPIYATPNVVEKSRNSRSYRVCENAITSLTPAAVRKIPQRDQNFMKRLGDYLTLIKN